MQLFNRLKPLLRRRSRAAPSAVRLHPSHAALVSNTVSTLLAQPQTPSSPQHSFTDNPTVCELLEHLTSRKLTSLLRNPSTPVSPNPRVFIAFSPPPGDTNPTLIHFSTPIVLMRPASVSEAKTLCDQNNTLLSSEPPSATTPAPTANPSCVAQHDTPFWIALIPSSSQDSTLQMRPVLTSTSYIAEHYPLCYEVAPEHSSAAPLKPAPIGWAWFIDQCLSEKTTLRYLLVASFVIQILALATPLATQAIVDKVISNQAVNTLLVLAIGTFLLNAFSSLLTWARQHLLLSSANTLDAKISKHIIERLLHLPLRYFESLSTGAVINRVRSLETIREFLTGTFTTTLIDIPFSLLFFSLMLWYSPHLSAIVLATCALVCSLSLFLGPVFQKKSYKAQAVSAQLQGQITEHISAIETLKALQLEPYALSRFSQTNQIQLDLMQDVRQMSNSFQTFNNFLEQSLNLAILTLGAYFAMTDSSLTIGMLLAFQMFSQRVTQPLLRLTGLWQQYKQTQASVDQLSELLNTPTENYSPQTSFLEKPSGALCASNLSFQYASNTPMLFQNLSFLIQPKTLCTLEGPSGCGKSTLMKMMQGHLAPSSGSITLDSRDISTLPVPELRSYFGVVPQESVLFSGTILENLLLAAPGASFSMIVQACQLADIHSTIQALPQGYHTPLGERGVGLSGGQRQRLAIARALLRKPQVLLFDEALSALDDKTATHLATTINNLKRHITIVFITHKIPPNLQIDQRITVQRLAHA